VTYRSSRQEPKNEQLEQKVIAAQLIFEPSFQHLDLTGY
jgi:hypothetical protein